jgi:hypothetical protein
MPILNVQLRRHSFVSTRSFDDVVARLTATIGRPDIRAFHGALVAATTASELATVVQQAIGTSELMEFIRFDAGEVVRKTQGGDGPRILRLVVGNPLIMQDMARTVPDAAAYAPVTILVDERADGVHLSYDSMASLLAPYDSPAATAVASDLDAQVLRLIEDAAGSIGAPGPS